MGRGRAIPTARRSIRDVRATCRRATGSTIAAGVPYALRLDMAGRTAATGPLAWSESGPGPNGETGMVAAAPQAWGDVVLARKDMPTSYHLSVVVDDALQGVTHVVRGQDLFWATSVHRLLQTLLGLPAPAYHHHRLVLDQDGAKLAKSTRSTALRELRAGGATPADIRRIIGLGLTWSMTRYRFRLGYGRLTRTMSWWRGELDRESRQASDSAGQSGRRKRKVARGQRAGGGSRPWRPPSRRSPMKCALPSTAFSRSANCWRPRICRSASGAGRPQ